MNIFRKTMLFICIFFLSFHCYSQVEYSLAINNQQENDFWDPLEIQVILFNNTNQIRSVIQPPQGRVDIRIKGEEKWHAVGFEKPLGYPAHNDQFFCSISGLDTFFTYLLIRPLYHFDQDRKKVYTFLPGNTYEIRYLYNSEWPDGTFEYIAYSTVKITGSEQNSDFLLLDNLEDPFYLFNPGYRFSEQQKYLLEAEIIAKNLSSTFQKWAKLYVYISDYYHDLRIINDNSLPYEERLRIYKEAKQEYLDYKETCESDYIRDLLEKRFEYSWVY